MASQGSCASSSRWPAEVHDPSSDAVAALRQRLADRIEFYQWLQWVADEQLGRLLAVPEGDAGGGGLAARRQLAHPVDDLDRLAEQAAGEQDAEAAAVQAAEEVDVAQRAGPGGARLLEQAVALALAAQHVERAEPVEVDHGHAHRHLAAAGAGQLARELGVEHAGGREAREGIGQRQLAEAVALAEALQQADLVITGEGRFDTQTAAGKAPAEEIEPDPEWTTRPGASTEG